MIIVTLAGGPAEARVVLVQQGESQLEQDEQEFEQTVDQDLGAEAEANTATQPDNPILPVMPEIIWGLGTFLVLWALMKFVLLKPYTETMQARADKVRGDLEAAERADEAAATALAEYEASLAGARVEASRLVDDARAQAEAKRREIVGAAESQVAEAKAEAASEVADAKAQAMAEMRPAVTTLATQAAQVVVGRPLDPAAQQAVVEEYLDRNANRN